MEDDKAPGFAEEVLLVACCCQMRPVCTEDEDPGNSGTHSAREAPPVPEPWQVQTLPSPLALHMTGAWQALPVVTL